MREGEGLGTSRYPDYNGDVVLLSTRNEMLEQIVIVKKADDKALMTIELFQEMVLSPLVKVEHDKRIDAERGNFLVTFGTADHGIGVVTYRLTFVENNSFILMDRI